MRRVLPCLILMTLCLSSFAQEAIPLQMRLKAGDTLPLRVVTSQELSQAMMGRTHVSREEVEMRFEVAVETVDAAGAIVATATWTGAAIRRATPEKVAGATSLEPLFSDTAAFSDALKGQRFSFRLTPAGEVSGVSGGEAVVKRLLEVLKPSDDAERRILDASLRERYSDDALCAALRRVFGVLPAKPVAVGESWPGTGTGEQSYPFLIKSTYTLKSADAGQVTLEEKGEVTSDPKRIANIQGTGGRSYALIGGRTGTITLSRGTGWILGATRTTQTYGHVAIDSAGEDRKTVVPLSVKTEMRADGMENKEGEGQ